MILTDLPRALEKETRALIIDEASELKVILRNGFAATSANNNGVINIWKDHDNDTYSCERMDHFVVQDSFSSDDMEMVVKWTEKALKAIK